MSPHERQTALCWIAHVRECVAAGAGVETLAELERVIGLYLQNFKTQS